MEGTGAMSKIKAYIATLFLCFSFNAKADFNAVELVSDSFSGDCIDYCVKKLEYYIVCKVLPPSCRPHVSVRVAYRQPDAMVMVYNKYGQEPWTEWRNSFGKVMSKVEKPLVKAILGTKSNGGRTVLPQQSGTSHTIMYKYADVVGHPLAFMFNKLSRGRNDQPDYSMPRPPSFNLGGASTPKTGGGSLINRVNGSIPSPTDRDSARERAESFTQMVNGAKERTNNLLNEAEGVFHDPKAYWQNRYPDLDLDFSSWGSTTTNTSNTNITPEQASQDAALDMVKDFGNFDILNDKRFAKIADVDGIKQAMKAQERMGELQQTFSKVQQVLDGFGGGVTGGNLFCPSKIAPFNPYFISGIDTVGWRLGMPDRMNFSTYMPHRDVVGSFPSNKWGKIYPRTGFIYAIEDNKAGAVIAERAMHLITRDNQKHVYSKLPGAAHSPNQESWQMLHPNESKQCRAFGRTRSFEFSPNSRDGSYAFNYWRRYSCVLNPKGFHVGSTRLNICI